MGKLYVGNLPFNATEEAVSSIFAVHGEVKSVKIISDRETGKSRGFCFVEMDNSDAALALNGTDMDGRALKVSVAIDKPKGDRGGQRDNRGGGDNRGGSRWNGKSDYRN